MVTTKIQTPTTSQFVEILTQVIGNPIEMKSSDLMLGMICDTNGNPQDNVKDLVNGSKYWFLAYEDLGIDDQKGMPNYNSLPKYAVPFKVKKFDDETTKNVFVAMRTVLNAASTIFDFGIYCQDQAMGRVECNLMYNKTELTTPKMYIGSYIKDGTVAFAMTVVEH